jgi:hypothetical protein
MIFAAPPDNQLSSLFNYNDEDAMDVYSTTEPF